MNLTVSIVTYHSSLDYLRKTLASLAQAAENARAAELVSTVAVTVVDNASSSVYRAQLSALLAEFETACADGPCQLHYLPLAANCGFSAGHNAALGRVRGDYHLILNPDVEIGPAALRVGLARLRDEPEVVLLSPDATGSNGEREYLCKRYPSVLVLALRAFTPGLGRRWCPERMADYEMSDVCRGDREVEVPLASGCFMLARGEQLAAAGDFDERYFLYFEDFDLSLRMATLGRVLYLPAMRIVHHGGYAGSKGFAHVKMFASAGIRFFRQHGWRWA
ncbi:hypothetical protein BST95_18190 [Halioglobus japonicus]|uniref:Glycosyl transferase n=1 Tax=Halioglobus japonicus TaxID=930805 RepID=A0AAP8SNV4_9GAMM|nr:hypothetical protein BST95_18190 [Halioglobus japonicus]PLW87032.1 glycosyl transferase [Halioglobus japonicus]GHD10573.1 glycosyl transferase [Halioglobus japonicus]